MFNAISIKMFTTFRHNFLKMTEQRYKSNSSTWISKNISRDIKILDFEANNDNVFVGFIRKQDKMH